MIRTAVAAVLALAAANAAEIAVVRRAAAPPLERLAAQELAAYLGKLYPNDRFTLKESPAPGARTIRIGTLESDPALARVVNAAQLETPESFVVRPGIIAGADPRGVLYGVYALLERLGCGFYLSYETIAPRREPFSFDAWRFEDAPLTGDRFVFDWHNFLSSASSWELDDWRHYISQAARMRFNGIMVHAYGNNPMFQFRHNGQMKPVGYLATTRSGRDWGTQHVNDVRRLVGGEVFDDAVFGVSAAKVPPERRAAAAAALMKEVFAFARSRGLGVTFALDVDTESANPQNMIRTLPAGARFRAGNFELANPETPEGYAYFKAQIAQLMETYPETGRLAIWFRNNRTPWTEIKAHELPAGWRAEYEAILARRPELGGNPNSAGYFAVGKLIEAARRALKEIGRGDVELATGNWRLSTIPRWDPFMPPGITYLPLDWNTVFETAAGQRDLRSVDPRRKVAPVVWAHHDDRTYIGRPYTPFLLFPSLLRHSRASGFGIIHWTTRPLDFYFKSLARQVWRASENEPLEETARRMALDTFGEAAGAAGAEYVFLFVTEAPMFGRETSNRFMDIPLKEPRLAVAQAKERLALLATAAKAALRPEERERLEFSLLYEQFLLSFLESHTAWERAAGLYKSGDIAAARREIARSRPEETIRAYAGAARRGRITRGEQALVISLNLRWLPYIVSLRQALGLEPLRVKFGPTEHEPLAQGAGSNTFFADAGRRLWRTLGEKETGAPAASWGGGELGETAIRIERPLKLRFSPLGGEPLAAGRYELELTFSQPPGAGEASVEIDGGSGNPVVETIPAGRAATSRLVFTLTESRAEIRLTPGTGAAHLAYAVISPAH